MSASSVNEPWLSSRSSTLVPNGESSASIGQPLLPLSKQDATKIDAKVVRDIEQKLWKFEPLIKQRSERRALLGLTLRSTGSALTSSGGLSSTNLGAASTAFARLSAHLDAILQNIEPTPSHSLGFAEYLEKLQRIPIHKFEPEELQDFTGTQHEWGLIKHAANASHQAYEEVPEMDDGQHFKAKGNAKAMIAYVDEVDGHHMLIIAVRGTVTKDDWMLNVNNAPKKSSKLLPNAAVWHGGFLTVAKAMAKQTADAILDIKKKQGSIGGILFTGHSAGGAIAQLFYAMSMTKGMKLSEAVSDFPEVNCVKFGTPPIASIPLHSSQGVSSNPGLFLSIVNEGDPVPQAQEEFIKTLIDVYVLNFKDLSQRYPDGVSVPQGHFRASGNTVILRDVDPNDENTNNIKPFTTDSHLLERELFGNPFVHSTREYLERIEQIEVS